ncbi:MAG: hypothetical protein O7C67_19835 [Gammaproteobacteria bacterium]|nr:hypothetical protein [Gammaproteobacteria bacterium]
MRTRRRFIAATGQATLGVWVVTSNAHGALAETLSVLEADTRLLQTLARVARLIYPHDGLSDSVYVRIVGDLLGDPQNTATLSIGAANLGEFLELDEAQQIAALQRIENGPFFNAVKTPLMGALYNSPELWTMIDYAGPSFPFGGYINRGFDDIDWLPTS